MKQIDKRRGFLGTAAAAAGSAVVLGSAGTASAAVPDGRRAIAGRPGAPFSRAVILDELVYVAGSVGRKPSGKLPDSFEGQCRQMFENMKASVEASGSTMAQVLKCTCFLTDVDDFATMNKLFREYFPTSPPARSTVVIKELVVKGAKIEADCVTSLTEED